MFCLRHSKTLANGDEEEYLWDGNNLVYVNPSLSEYLLTGFTAYYGLGLFESNQNGTKYRYQRNAHGDTTALLNQSGDIVRCYTYEDAFGTSTYSADDTNPFRYAGQYYDRESQSYYLRARYYLPRYGRFTAEDPARDGLNWYTYCANNPVRYYDPSGLDAIIITSSESAVGAGHTSGLFQDENDMWYYTYWALGSACVLPVPDSFAGENGETINTFDSLDNFNLMLQCVYGDYSIGGNYDQAIYIEGDFSKSIEGAQKMISKSGESIFNGLMSVGQDGLLLKGWNVNYVVIGSNCSQNTINCFMLGALQNGLSVKEYMKNCNYRSSPIPNIAHNRLGNIFYNNSFFKSESSAEELNNAIYSYYLKQLFGRKLGR